MAGDRLSPDIPGRQLQQADPTPVTTFDPAILVEAARQSPPRRIPGETTGDPRKSREERYKDAADFLSRTREAAEARVERGYLMPAEVDGAVERARERWMHAEGNEVATRSR